MVRVYRPPDADPKAEIDGFPAGAAPAALSLSADGKLLFVVTEGFARGSRARCTSWTSPPTSACRWCSARAGAVRRWPRARRNPRTRPASSWRR